MLLSQITFQHRIFSGPEEQIPAMNRVKEIIKSANLTKGQVFPLSQGYAAWEADEVIAMELYRNMALAIGCIFITTLFLLADVTASILGQAHHMFSRFLKLRIFLCFVFLQGRSFLLK